MNLDSKGFSASALPRTLAWRDGEAITLGQCLAEAVFFAERLPAHGQPVNLCSDRYLFTLALMAALQRGQTSLMPPNAMPHTLQQLGDPAAPAYALVDDASQDVGGLPSIVVSRPAVTANAAAAVPVDPRQWVACLLTSGSTGAPLPQRKRWDALQLSIAAEARSLCRLLDWPSIVGLNIVATVPPQHSYGFESSVLLALIAGAAFDAGRAFYPADIAETLARLPQPRALVTTPVHLKALLLSGATLPAVDLLLSATAPLSPQLARQAESRLGARLVEIYGCTEAGQVAARRTTAGDIWTTLDGLRITRQTGDDGERFSVSGGHVLEPTPLADQLELLDAQHFRLLGRANDLIHVAGKRCSLAHLNFHLNRIGGVDDGVFWLPDEVTDGVVRPVAFVVAPALSARQIIAALRPRIESAFLPRRVIHVESLPRQATGKITAQALREFAVPVLTQADRRGVPQTPDSAAVASESSHRIEADLRAFDGHFPGSPVLPGAYVLSLVLQQLERQPALRARLGATLQVQQVKFLAPVRPGQTLGIRLRVQTRGIDFSVHHGATLVARGQLGSTTEDSAA